MCTECTLAFFLSPVKSGIVAFSFMIAIAAFVMLRRLKTADTKKRLTLLYIHVFAFVFPFLFFVFFRGCQSYFSGCDKTKAIVTMIGLTALIATIIAAAVAPVIFAKRHSSKAVLLEDSYWNNFVRKHSEMLAVEQPRLYVLNTAATVAFSFSFLKSKIFLSAGLFDILGRKEIEAIILHELAHIRNKSSFFKLSAHIARLLSPFAALANFMGGNSVNEEEASADCYAATAQGTYRHLDSAKSKMAAYNSERSSA